MDIRLPGMNGFEATERIMRERPTPVVVVSASVEKADLQITMNALRAGALTVLEKPVGTTSVEYEAMAQKLCTQLAIMSQVKVVRRHRDPRPTPRLARPVERYNTAYRIVGVVSSTGGPNALVHLLNGLGSDFQVPIVLVQHITSSFLEGFAAWLDSVCPFAVEIVRNRRLPLRGKVHIAPADHHLRVENGYLDIDTGDPVCAQRPSGTVLFRSMANAFGGQALGVLLTGMGDDGAEGLLQIRRSGGYTIAEDESTAVVYGMPAEAQRMGAVIDSLPLPAIASRILELTMSRHEVA